MFVSVSSSMMVEAEIAASRHLLLRLWSFISFVSLSHVPWMLHMTSRNLWPWSGPALPLPLSRGWTLVSIRPVYVVVERSESLSHWGRCQPLAQNCAFLCFSSELVVGRRFSAQTQITNLGQVCNIFT